MNYSEIYKRGTQRLSAAEIPEAALDARLLLEFLTGETHQTLLVYPDTPVSDEVAGKYAQLLDKRASHVPLSQITGSCGFMGIEFLVDENVLSPRQDSECLVEEAMRYVNDGDDILDLCTGSGCLLLSLMHYKNGCRGIGTDISEKALKVAKENAARLTGSGGLNGGSAEFLHGDLFDALRGDDKKFDAVISNPPYIRTGDIASLMPEVRDHEPHAALDGGNDGLTFYRRIAQDAGRYLKKEGRLFLEIGYDQAEDVSQILADAGFSGITDIKDYAGNDRVIHAKY